MHCTWYFFKHFLGILLLPCYKLSNIVTGLTGPLSKELPDKQVCVPWERYFLAGVKIHLWAPLKIRSPFQVKLFPRFPLPGQNIRWQPSRPGTVLISRLTLLQFCILTPNPDAVGNQGLFSNICQWHMMWSTEYECHVLFPNQRHSPLRLTRELQALDDGGRDTGVFHPH